MFESKNRLKRQINSNFRKKCHRGLGGGGQKSAENASRPQISFSHFSSLKYFESYRFIFSEREKRSDIVFIPELKFEIRGRYAGPLKVQGRFPTLKTTTAGPTRDKLFLL